MKTCAPSLSLRPTPVGGPEPHPLPQPKTLGWPTPLLRLLLAAVTVLCAAGPSQAQTADVDPAAPPASVVYVDYRSTCSTPDGTADCPYPTLTQGCSTVAPGGVVKIRPGPYAFPLGVLVKPLQLESDGGQVLISASGLPGRPADGVVWPPLSTVGTTAEGAFAFRFSAVPGERYWIFTTTDLVAWTLWREEVAERAVVDLVYPWASDERRRFFTLAMP